MNKTIDALKLAEEALLNTGNALMAISAGRNLRQLYGEMRDGAVERCNKALAAIREALANQSIVLNDPHPPHRLCECTACLEYWTPLPDCDAFAASGKPIDHIADTGKVIAEPVCKRCNGTKIVSDGEIDNIGGADLEVPIECVRDCPDCAKPVKQEPVALLDVFSGWSDIADVEIIYHAAKKLPDGEYKLYAAPVQPVKQEPVALDEVRRIAAEYAEPNSQVDSGNLYWALCEALKYTAPVDAKAIRADQRKKDAEACYLRANSWKDNAARAAKLCGDAITAMGRDTV